MKIEEAKKVVSAMIFIQSFVAMNRLDIVRNKYYCGLNIPSLFETEQFKKRKEFIDKTFEEDFEKYLWLIERPFRFEELLENESRLTNEHFAKLVAEVWVDSENPEVENLEVWRSLFESLNSSSLMNEEDFLFWQKLPEKFVVYRGVDEVNPNWSGLAWTLDLKIAVWFSLRFSPNNLGIEDFKCDEYFLNRLMDSANVKIYEEGQQPEDGERCVLKKTIKKSEAKAYFGFRNESEIIIL